MNEPIFDCCWQLFDHRRAIEIKWEKLQPFQSGGKPCYAPAQICRGIITARQTRREGTTLTLLLPPSVAAAPGDRITWQRKHYHLSTVQDCCTVDGQIAARRCQIQ